MFQINVVGEGFQMYTLRKVAVHEGQRLSRGHYKAFVYSQDWYCVDDTRVCIGLTCSILLQHCGMIMLFVTLNACTLVKIATLNLNWKYQNTIVTGVL